MSLFCCPICAAPLQRGARAYLCPNGHGYDIAKEGYVNLLPANRMHAKHPGDDREMAAARSRFLSKGYYAHLRDALCALAQAYAPEQPALLDAGCGEGWYTAGIYAALAAAGKVPQMAGVDLSKPSLRWAARRERGMECAVASVYHLPMAGERVDLLLNCFSPLALNEFRRVLRPGGIFMYVVPAADHLWELKEVLYETPYRNPEEETPYAGFAPLGVRCLGRTIAVAGADLGDLFRMTPYYWKTPRAGAERLEKLDGLNVTASFRVYLFQKVPILA